ncbi:MAG: hypothetical protein J1F35_07320 [Erysipelotrichales bacterium]|nr:hypothetical protein [Erysipelotrichales bacterium]
METQSQINFAEVKTILNGVQTYILAKQAVNNSQIEQPAVVNQEMNLASQPEIPSDHLLEETVLSSEGINVDANETMDKLDAGLETPVPDITETLPQGMPNTSTDAFAQVASEQNIIPEVQTMISEQVGDVSSQPDASSMLDTSATSLMNDTTISSDQTEEVPIMDAAMPEVEPANEALSDAPAGLETIQGTDFVQSGNVVTNDAINNDSSLAYQNTEFPMAQDGLIEGTEQAQTYVASGNAASTVITEIAPAVSTEPVVMPTGTTPDMGNNPELVVSAESFGPTL